MAGIRASLQCRRGSAVVEFTLIAPIAIYLMLATANFGMFILAQMKLATAVNAGAQWAQSYYVQQNAGVYNFNTWNATPTLWTSTYTKSIIDVIKNTAGLTGVNPTVIYNNYSYGSSICLCPSGSAGSWTYAAPTSSPACSSTCASGAYAGKFTAISASYTFYPIVPNPWLPSTGTTIHEYALVQVQ